jgi:predicted RNase H-like nuclease
VHSPTATRPGPLSETVGRGFERRGYRLATTARPRELPALLEVYPHTALLSLLGAERRVPYKIARSRRYWPEEPPEGRRARLLAQWRTILEALRGRAGIEISPRVFALPARCTSFSGMKRYEDALDAILCAWVGAEFLRDRADPLGDDTAAIWTPHRASLG